jgi:hypothetical protein
MKTLIILSLALTILAGPEMILDETAEVVPQSMIVYINSIQSSWIASKAWVGSMKII